jgi:hypothetical protein
MSKEIDLAEFCSCDPKRPELACPFSFADWSFATDGAILVRVPRISDVPENPAAPNKKAAALFDAARVRYRPAPQFDLPDSPLEWEESKKCWTCQGSGKTHVCPDCQCPCPQCDGKGSLTIRDWHRTQIGKAFFNSRYVDCLQKLPSLELGRPHRTEPMRFRFDGGGEGLLMPCGRSDLQRS